MAPPRHSQIEFRQAEDCFLLFVAEYHLDELRLGDIVALLDCDNTNGRNFITGALSIGVIVHGSCKISGHGPGVTTLFSCLTGKLGYELQEKANLADMLL